MNTRTKAPHTRLERLLMLLDALRALREACRCNDQRAAIAAHERIADLVEGKDA